MTGQAVERHHEPANGVALPSERDRAGIEYSARAIAVLDSRIKGRRDAADLAVALAVTLWNYGLKPTATNAKKLHLIPGKNDTFEIFESAQLLLGLLQMHGYKVRVIAETEDLVTLRGWEAGDDEPHDVTYTAARAAKSGALDEWVERKYRNPGDNYDRTEKFVVAVDGVLAAKPLPEWAQTLVDAGRVNRNDYWSKYRVDALLNRAIRRLAKRMGAAALLGVDLADDEPARVAPRPDDVIVADDEDLEQPAEAVEEKMPEAAAPTPAPTDEADPDPAAAHRNECSRVHAASARIPEGLWRQQWAEAWRKAELPAARDLTPEQLEPARQLVRCYIALAALDGVGLGDRKERHDFVHAATAGETESCKALSAAQLALVLAAVDTYAAARAGAPVEAEYGPGEEPFE